MSHDVQQKISNSQAIRYAVEKDGKEVGHVYLYLIFNDLHEEPYGFMEDLFVDEAYRKQGIGKALLEKMMEGAKEHRCYKLIGNSRKSREHVHGMYKKLGFEEWGYEFRMDLFQ